MKSTKRSKLAGNQEGFASLIIAIILVIVLSLLTVGFAELMRHSQTQELNRHLSDQAYYAAESGINDAVRALNNGYNQTKSTCGPLDASDDSAGAQYLKDPSVSTDDATGATNWTCLLIDPTPESLEYNPVETVTPTIFTFKPTSGTISQLNIYWQDADKSNTNFRVGSYSGSGAFPPNVSWNSIGMLRVGLTPLGDMSRNGLISNTYTAFLYPDTAASGTGSYGINTIGFASNGGEVLDGGCDTSHTPRFCHATINSIPPSGNGYMVSLRSIYSSTNVYITGNDGSASFSGAQSLVDSTGKAQNILKRIQVRVPDRAHYPYPGFDVDSTGSICKQLSARPGSVQLGC